MRKIFITSNQLLEIDDENEIVDFRLEFLMIKIFGNLDLTPYWVKWRLASFRHQLNVPIIEFSKTASKVLSQIKYSPLIPTA